MKPLEIDILLGVVNDYKYIYNEFLVAKYSNFYLLYLITERSLNLI